MAWIEVREPRTDKLLFRFDPERDLIEVKRRESVTIVDLTMYTCDQKESPNTQN